MDINDIRKNVLESLKKVQSKEQLNVSDSLLEKIAIQLTESLRVKLDEEVKDKDIEGYLEEYISSFSLEEN